MRLSYRWLMEFIDIDWTPEELASRLTMAGLEVDSIESIETFGSVVGEVIEAVERDGLVLCKADIGGKVVNIATADSTVRRGEKFPVVLAGSRIGGRTIEKRKFGYFTSEGMFLSAEELGLEDSSSELFRLDESFKNGTPLKDLSEFDDKVLEIELTPNRADALSVLGVARDVKALAKREIRLPNVAFDVVDKSITDVIDVKIEDSEDCPRYTLAVADVEVKRSPFFMRMRLLKSGMRAINNVVDITNYVLMALGQPMHAFDLNKLKGDIIVRKAKSGERIVALDGKEYVLDDSMLVIADEESPVAIAGIMGGEFSSVDDNTKTIALESAFFRPTNVRLTSRKLKLHTEASHRFERGVDPNLCIDASKYALSLLEKYANAKIYRGFIDRKAKKFKPRSIVVSFEGINRLLGSSFSSSEIEDVLVGLNMGVERIESGNIRVKVPTYRFDMECEADVAEEVARIKGYDKIPSTYPVVETRFKVEDKTERLSRDVSKALAVFGLFETKNYAFVDDSKLKLFDKNESDFVYLKNPLIDTQNVMRTTLAVSLMDTLVFNINKGARSVPIFEVGRVFFKDGDFAREFVRAGFLLWGLKEFSWHGSHYFDFYDAKGACEIIGGIIGVDFEYKPSARPFLHPGRAADVFAGGVCLGYVGELHPDLYKPYDIKFDKRNRVLIGEVDLTLASSVTGEQLLYRQLPKLPTVWRDLAVVVDKGTRWADMESVVRGVDYVYNVALFDVYDKLDDPNKVSVAFRVVLRRDDRSFTEEEIESIVGVIYDKLRKRFNAKLRGE